MGIQSFIMGRYCTSDKVYYTYAYHNGVLYRYQECYDEDHEFDVSLEHIVGSAAYRRCCITDVTGASWDAINPDEYTGLIGEFYKLQIIEEW